MSARIHHRSDPVDRHIGGQVRIARMLAGKSQTELGAALGVTFQQIQKYERGANRISASKLQAIARVLGVTVSHFFEGSPEAPALPGRSDGNAASVAASELFATAEGARLAKAFAGITSLGVRRRLADLAEALAEEAGSDGAAVS